MGHEFEDVQEADVEATLDEVWQAIATGPGIDSWFMGHTEVTGDFVRTAFGEYAQDPAPITAQEPGRRFAYRTPTAPDGRFVAFDFLVEGRDGGGAALRVVTSGFIPGDDWEDEFEAMSLGGALYFSTLVEYLNHFAGRIATPIFAAGPPVADWPGAWARLGAALGLDRRVRAGDRVRLAAEGGAAQEGVVYFANADTAGIRTDDALYRFIRGFRGPMLVMHQLFRPGVDAGGVAADWSAWLSRTLG